MAGSSDPSPSPKILLAKPGLVSGGPVATKFGRGSSGVEDESAQFRSRLPSVASLNLLSDSWEFHIDRFLPFLTENTDFTVVGVIGPPGVGKSTIMNELYGFDSSSPGMLPPFSIESNDTSAMARHCSVGIEPRISSERIILLDTQPVFSAPVLAEMMRPDSPSTASVLSGESLSAEMAHKIMGIQVDLLKHGISNPFSLASSVSQSSSSGLEKDNKVAEREEYMATPVFVHSKVQDRDATPQNFVLLKKALLKYFETSSFVKHHYNNSQLDSNGPNLHLHMIPLKKRDENFGAQHESFISALWKLREQILSMKSPSSMRPASEREWLKHSAKVWEQVRNSPIILEYCRTLQQSGLFRR
ncbi:protein SMG9 isoform X2 [Neltuma alba]|uniref:protein SMG9 isoform X2 n=1 Tax=Neltuma alba TaxID=207710 RepID=UPI0010A4D909|nr:protein SMG9-like isoform X2 [Prosopis alba]